LQKPSICLSFRTIGGRLVKRHLPAAEKSDADAVDAQSPAAAHARRKAESLFKNME
jgi:hypothetical protein